VNIDGGPTKSGVAPLDALTLAREVAQYVPMRPRPADFERIWLPILRLRRQL
jgi:hypothetical protein